MRGGIQTLQHLKRYVKLPVFQLLSSSTLCVLFKNIEILFRRTLLRVLQTIKSCVYLPYNEDKNIVTRPALQQVMLFTVIKSITAFHVAIQKLIPTHTSCILINCNSWLGCTISSHSNMFAIHDLSIIISLLVVYNQFFVKPCYCITTRLEWSSIEHFG